MKQQEPVDKELRALLAPHSAWKPTPTRSEQQAARLALFSCCQLLEKTPALKRRKRKAHPLSYLCELGYLYIALNKHHFINACNELEKLIHFHQILDPPVRENVLALLHKHVGGNDEISME